MTKTFSLIEIHRTMGALQFCIIEGLPYVSDQGWIHVNRTESDRSIVQLARYTGIGRSIVTERNVLDAHTKLNAIDAIEHSTQRITCYYFVTVDATDFIHENKMDLLFSHLPSHRSVGRSVSTNILRYYVTSKWNLSECFAFVVTHFERFLSVSFQRKPDSNTQFVSIVILMANISDFYLVRINSRPNKLRQRNIKFPEKNVLCSILECNRTKSKGRQTQSLVRCNVFSIEWREHDAHSCSCQNQKSYERWIPYFVWS